jgi:hypothetical protein
VNGVACAASSRRRDLADTAVIRGFFNSSDPIADGLNASVIAAFRDGSILRSLHKLTSLSTAVNMSTDVVESE